MKWNVGTKISAGFAVALAVFLVVVVSRFVWVYPATFLPRILSARIRDREENPTWKGPFVIAWAGMRGVVSLAIAFSIPRTISFADAV